MSLPFDHVTLRANICKNQAEIKKLWKWPSQYWFIFIYVKDFHEGKWTKKCSTVTEKLDWSFCYFEQFKVDTNFVNFGQVKIDPKWSLLLTLDRSQLFDWVWARHATKNNPKNSRTTHKIWHKSFLMIQSVGIKNWFPQSINRLQSFSLLFLPVTRFLIFATK